MKPGHTLPGLREHAAVIFDCDGVLLDSNAMKSRAFEQTLTELGVEADIVARFAQHQRHSFGVSRHRLFKGLLDGAHGPVPAGLDMQVLLERFGLRCRQGYQEVPETPGALALLQQLSGTPCMVVSGSEQDELRQALQARGLARFFQAILGSPASKSENLAQVRAALATSGPLIYFGDAEADADAAASDPDCAFVFVARYSTVRAAMLARMAREGRPTVDTLADLLTPETCP